MITNLVLFGASGDVAGRFCSPRSRRCTRRAGFRRVRDRRHRRARLTTRRSAAT
jgi:hypothetical protein